ncbi:MAG: polysaccharide pyruvyl transferase family protein, partial [Armatimonadetes bacterium]|nr:polysaccharide pyruvyl transferase family protein [Armatimonadota bacterium]
MTSLPPSILLSGYYGYGNVGDDAILLALARELRAGGVARIVVPAGDQTGAFAGEGLEFVRRFDLRAIRAALQDGARVVSGGGGLFQDTTSVRSLVYYLGVLQLARQAGRRYVICGQSIGPLERAFSRFAVSRALAGAAAVSVRDRRS